MLAMAIRYPCCRRQTDRTQRAPYTCTFSRDRVFERVRLKIFVAQPDSECKDARVTWTLRIVAPSPAHSSIDSAVTLRPAPSSFSSSAKRNKVWVGENELGGDGDDAASPNEHGGDGSGVE